MRGIIWIERLGNARQSRAIVRGVAATLLAAGLAGCTYIKPKPQEKYVYVTAKEAFLRDRVAAVSNRTATVTNGEKLTILERSRRFVKVRTPDGVMGWIEENKVIDDQAADQFIALGKQHEKDPVVASAKTQDEVVLHIAPGRETPHFYRLNENDGLDLLERATVVKPQPPGTAAAKKPEDSSDAVPPPPPMEDWWLVRDAKGQTGWIISRMIDVNVPESLARYSEGQRIVGFYVLTHVDDPDSGMTENGQTVTSIPEYVTVLSPYKAGLPYDFDQVRVFTWNVKKHRYETAFREHNIEGYLPVQIESRKDPYGKGELAQQALPSFTYHVLAADEATPTPDPTTGELKPGKTISKVYRLEGNICRRILAPGSPAPPEAHPVVEDSKKDKAKKHGR